MSSVGSSIYDDELVAYESVLLSRESDVLQQFEVEVKNQQDVVLQEELRSRQEELERKRHLGASESARLRQNHSEEMQNLIATLDQEFQAQHELLQQKLRDVRDMKLAKRRQELLDKQDNEARQGFDGGSPNAYFQARGGPVAVEDQFSSSEDQSEQSVSESQTDEADFDTQDTNEDDDQDQDSVHFSETDMNGGDLILNDSGETVHYIQSPERQHNHSIDRSASESVPVIIQSFESLQNQHQPAQPREIHPNRQDTGTENGHESSSGEDSESSERAQLLEDIARMRRLLAAQEREQAEYLEAQVKAHEEALEEAQQAIVEEQRRQEELRAQALAFAEAQDAADHARGDFVDVLDNDSSSDFTASSTQERQDDQSEFTSSDENQLLNGLHNRSATAHFNGDFERDDQSEHDDLLIQETDLERATQTLGEAVHDLSQVLEQTARLQNNELEHHQKQLQQQPSTGEHHEGVVGVIGVLDDLAGRIRDSSQRLRSFVQHAQSAANNDLDSSRHIFVSGSDIEDRESRPVQVLVSPSKANQDISHHGRSFNERSHQSSHTRSRLSHGDLETSESSTDDSEDESSGSEIAHKSLSRSQARRSLFDELQPSQSHHSQPDHNSQNQNRNQTQHHSQKQLAEVEDLAQSVGISLSVKQSSPVGAQKAHKKRKVVAKKSRKARKGVPAHKSVFLSTVSSHKSHRHCVPAPTEPDTKSAKPKKSTKKRRAIRRSRSTASHASLQTKSTSSGKKRVLKKRRSKKKLRATQSAANLTSHSHHQQSVHDDNQSDLGDTAQFDTIMARFNQLLQAKHQSNHQNSQQQQHELASPEKREVLRQALASQYHES